MGIFLDYLWHLALPLAVGIGLITALFYVQGTAKIIIRMALVGVVILCGANHFTRHLD